MALISIKLIKLRALISNQCNACIVPFEGVDHLFPNQLFIYHFIVHSSIVHTRIHVCSPRLITAIINNDNLGYF